jgi:UDP-glucuronate 4-epimerase
MNILVTGAVGFIGFSLCESFIKKKHKVLGIDNFDTYYSIEIKKRLKILDKNKNFYFKKIIIKIL